MQRFLRIYALASSFRLFLEHKHLCYLQGLRFHHNAIVDSGLFLLRMGFYHGIKKTCMI